MNGSNDLSALLRSDWEALVESFPVQPERSPVALPPQQRVPLRPAALFAELEDVLRVLTELRAPVVKHADRYINGAWTLRQLLAHLASWAREFRYQVETAGRGESFDYAIPFALSVIGPNEWNEQQVQARRERSLEEILDELEGETRRLQDLVLEMPMEALNRAATFPQAPGGDPDARWSGPPAVVILGKCRHDRYHLAQIQAQIASWEKLESS